MKKWLIIGIVGLVCLLVFFRIISSGRPGYNVLLISIESLRADHLGCYGYKRNTSPVIDSVAKEGILFENAISTTSWTLPSHMSIFTSMVPSVHGVNTEGYSLNERIPTIAQMLKRYDYATAAFCTSPYMNAAYGFARGFDLYYNTDTKKDDYTETLSSSFARDRASHADITSSWITNLAEKWLFENRKERFFLFIHMWDVHYDYIPPPPYDTMFDPGYKGKISPHKYMDNDEINTDMDRRDLQHIIALYDGEIAYVDHHIGMILKKLRELGLEDKTLIIITADHGEEFFDHGKKGHRQSLYDEVTRVPLIIRMPDGERHGRVVQNQVSLVDIAPTILNTLHIRAPGQMQGESLLPLIRGISPRRDAYALSELDQELHSLKALRANGWKMIYNVGEKVAVILDLKKDPAETHRYLVKSPEVWNEAQEELSRRLSTSRELANKYRGSEKGAPVELGEIDKEKLRSLGYID